MPSSRPSLPRHLARRRMRGGRPTPGARAGGRPRRRRRRRGGRRGGCARDGRRAELPGRGRGAAGGKRGRLRRRSGALGRGGDRCGRGGDVDRRHPVCAIPVRHRAAEPGVSQQPTLLSFFFPRLCSLGCASKVARAVLEMSHAGLILLIAYHWRMSIQSISLRGLSHQSA